MVLRYCFGLADVSPIDTDTSSFTWGSSILWASEYGISVLFQGASIRAAGELFAGRSPTWMASVRGILQTRHSLLLVFPMIMVGHVLATLFVVSLIVTCMVFLGLEWPSEMESVSLEAMVWLFPAAVVFLALVAFYICGMYIFSSTSTSVVLENKSAIHAIKRSWNLRMSRLGFVLGATVPVAVMNTLAGVVGYRSSSFSMILASISLLTSLLTNLLGAAFEM